MRRARSHKGTQDDYRYARWIGLYLSFHSSWVLGPFVHGRVQHLQTNEDTFGHVLISLIRIQGYIHLHLAARYAWFQSPVSDRNKESPLVELPSL